MSENKYIHGYSEKEQLRLINQNNFLSQYIYKNIDFSEKTNLLEIGCGVGAQMMYIMSEYPEINITGVDISETQIKQARQNLSAWETFNNRYKLFVRDASSSLSGIPKIHDHLHMVWVLEHVPNSENLLKNVKEYLKSRATISITEVFDESMYIYPECPVMNNYWNKSMKLKTEISGDANVGMRLFNLLENAGYVNIEVKPRVIYFDNVDQEKRKRMFLYWLDLLESGFGALEDRGLTNHEEWNKIKDEVNNLIGVPQSVFYYTFVQAFANVPA